MTARQFIAKALRVRDVQWHIYYALIRAACNEEFFTWLAAKRIHRIILDFVAGSANLTLVAEHPSRCNAARVWTTMVRKMLGLKAPTRRSGMKKREGVVNKTGVAVLLTCKKKDKAER